MWPGLSGSCTHDLCPVFFFKGFLDPEKKLFSHRILSRDECIDPFSKTGNLRYVPGCFLPWYLLFRSHWKGCVLSIRAEILCLFSISAATVITAVFLPHTLLLLLPGCPDSGGLKARAQEDKGVGAGAESRPWGRTQEMKVAEERPELPREQGRLGIESRA